MLQHFHCLDAKCASVTKALSFGFGTFSKNNTYDKASLHILTTVTESIPKKQVQFHDHSTHCHHYEQMALMEKEP
jgi:hypothetical protein